MRLLPLLLCLAACAPPDEAPRSEAFAAQSAPSPTPAPAPADSFDARAWLAEVQTVLARPSDDARAREVQRLAAALNDALDWHRACDTYRDEDGAEVYDPVMRESGTSGELEVTPIRDDTALIAVTCYFGAYQGAYALVHIEDERASLVRAPYIDIDGQPADYDTGVFSTPGYGGLAEGEFRTYAKGRGLGDCGMLVHYRLVDLGRAEVREVRSQECDYEGEPVIEPSEWPVVYRAEG